MSDLSYTSLRADVVYRVPEGARDIVRALVRLEKNESDIEAETILRVAVNRLVADKNIYIWVEQRSGPLTHRGDKTTKAR